MKLEVGESLACSWLRHVRQCWLVQANWKFAEHLVEHLKDDELDELDELFRTMKRRFDRDGSVFGQTKGTAQLLKQGEMDAVGVNQKGTVHAVEVAFHEGGLRYGTAEKTGLAYSRRCCVRF